MRFTDRVAVVTGGAQGIGAATAATLAKGGASVAVVDLTADRSKSIVEKITLDWGRALAIGCDVTKADAVTAMAEQVFETWDASTSWVNNAGITRDNMLFTMPEADWNAVLTTNLTSMFLCCQASGYIATARTAATAERVGATPEEHQKHVAANTPLRRAGRPEEVASVIAFLASDDASYVSGQTLYVNGGAR